MFKSPKKNIKVVVVATMASDAEHEEVDTRPGDDELEHQKDSASDASDQEVSDDEEIIIGPAEFVNPPD